MARVVQQLLFLTTPDFTALELLLLLFNRALNSSSSHTSQTTEPGWEKELSIATAEGD